MGRQDLPKEAEGASRLDQDESDDIEAELAAGGREACSVGFGSASDMRQAFGDAYRLPRMGRR